MRKGLHAWLKMMPILLAGCSTGGQPAAVTCSKTQSIIKTETFNAIQLNNPTSGLLLTTHITLNPENLQQPLNEVENLSQCNASLEMVQESPAKVRIWTASHCLKPLLLTSLTLAIRDTRSETSEYFKWKIDHPLLQKAKLMRSSYNAFAGASLLAQRERLYRAFDRRNMIVEGSNAILTPRVSCENLRWSQQADTRHSLCFSIFDLIYLDVALPEPESEKSKALMMALSATKPDPNTQGKLAEKRETFLRRMSLTSQAEWIIHEGNRVRQFMTSFARSEFPFFSEDVLEIEKLNREVFDLPHPEESSSIQPQDYTTQDAIPPAVNETYSVRSYGNYTSSRTSVNGVNVSCHRQRRRFNTTTQKVEVLPELETRPHEFCPGGSKFQADHFWNRDRPWSIMVADMTLGAAQEFSSAILELLNQTQNGTERLNRFSISASFSMNDDLGFNNVLADLSTPFLRHLRVPINIASDEIFGLNQLVNTGAFLLSRPVNESRLRFLSGDSGSIVLLDGVPVATLYSVDGVETSGGSSILPLPESIQDDEEPRPPSMTTGQRKTGQITTTGCK